MNAKNQTYLRAKLIDKERNLAMQTNKSHRKETKNPGSQISIDLLSVSTEPWHT